MNEKCIESWKKFSAYIPLSGYVMPSLEKIMPQLPNNAKVADIGGGNPLNPASSSYLLNSLLEKSNKDYALDVYDINGEQPKNERIQFIKGDIQKTYNSNANYDFALSVNALQTPSIPANFPNKIHESLKTGCYLLMLLPKKLSNEKELFQSVEATIKDYPKGITERRYSNNNLNKYFPQTKWHTEHIIEHPFSASLDKKMLDFYFSNPNAKETAKNFVESFNATENYNVYFKNKLLEYFNLTQGSDFTPIKLESKFLEILIKKV